MILSERHIISRNDDRYKELSTLCHLSKNLYNATLYTVRQHYFETKEYLNYFSVDKLFKETNNVDYRSLPAKVSQQTMKLVDKSFKSFFSLLKKKQQGNYSKPVHIPSYLTKDGFFPVVYTVQAISKQSLRDNIIKLSQTSIEVKTKVSNPSQVRVIPKIGHIVIEVLYEVEERQFKDNGRCCAIDIGVNNLAAVSSNVSAPFIINGRPLKSINQYFNKRLAYYQSILYRRNGKFTSNRLTSLYNKRDRKISDYLRKSSRMLVNQLADRSITTLVIGRNKEWKQDISIGSANNQSFVQIPFYKFIAMLTYKCKLLGIKVVETEESYTSKCSFLDNEEVQKHEVYKGKRVKRGLFRSSDGTYINADINGSYNILRKVAGKISFDSVEVCSTPAVLTAKLN